MGKQIQGVRMALFPCKHLVEIFIGDPFIDQKRPIVSHEVEINDVLTDCIAGFPANQGIVRAHHEW